MGAGRRRGNRAVPARQPAVTAPAVRVPPLNNSLLVFENTPRARHAFIANQRSPRNSVILWLHRPVEQARLLFGQGALFRWPRPRVPPAKPGSGGTRCGGRAARVIGCPGNAAVLLLYLLLGLW